MIMVVPSITYRIAGINEISVIHQFLCLSLIIISSIDKRVTNSFCQIKNLSVQFVTNSSNLNVVNNTHHTKS